MPTFLTYLLLCELELCNKRTTFGSLLLLTLYSFHFADEDVSAAISSFLNSDSPTAKVKQRFQKQSNKVKVLQKTFPTTNYKHCIIGAVCHSSLAFSNMDLTDFEAEVDLVVHYISFEIWVRVVKYKYPKDNIQISSSWAIN